MGGGERERERGCKVLSAVCVNFACLGLVVSWAADWVIG